MRVAVTGAAGYLGRAVVNALAGDDDVEEVVAIDLRASPGPSKVRAVVRDVRDPGLAEDLAGQDALVHLAFVVLGSGRGAESINVEGSRNAFDSAVRAGVGTIVHASSSAVYGCSADNPVPLREDAPLRAVPDFYYPRDKIAVERLLDSYEDRARVVRLRPIAVLGPGAPRVLGGRAWLALTDYDPPMQFLWIDDLLAMVRSVLREPVSGAFNAGAPDPVRASEVARLAGIRSLRAPHRVVRAGARAASVLGGMHPAWVDMLRFPIVVSTERAERDLAWTAGCDCSEALRRFGACAA